MADVIFKLASDPSTTPVINWSAAIDDDGDLDITANGIKLFFISKNEGNIHRYWKSPATRAEIPSLSFDNDGMIKVAE